MAKKKTVNISSYGNTIEIKAPAAPLVKVDAKQKPYKLIFGHNTQYRNDRKYINNAEIEPGQSYFDIRMKELGITSELNTFTPKGAKIPEPIFYETDKEILLLGFIILRGSSKNINQVKMMKRKEIGLKTSNVGGLTRIISK